MRLKKEKRGSFWAGLAVSFAILSLGLAHTGWARMAIQPTPTDFSLAKPTGCKTPSTLYCGHKVGKLWLMVTNFGQFGDEPDNPYFAENCFPGVNKPGKFSAQYPGGSGTEYLFTGALWCGAVSGKDTLTTTAFDGWLNVSEMFADVAPQGDFTARSINPGSPFYSPDAISTFDLIAAYTDTMTCSGFVNADQYSGRGHKPLNIKVIQKSYSWDYSYAKDFVLFDYQVINMGKIPLESFWMGIYIDADVWPSRLSSVGFKDDLAGFRQYALDPATGDSVINVAYIGDNDGDGEGGVFKDKRNTKAVTGTRVVRTPNPDLKFSFNWWISEGTNPVDQDWGPQTLAKKRQNYSGGWGTPEGDIIKYWYMSNNEFDYDQIQLELEHRDWIPPPKNADSLVDGFDTRYLLSFGPFDVNPGDTLPITLAYVAGDDWHRNANDWKNTFPAGDFSKFKDSAVVNNFINNTLNWDDLARNAQWAGKVYDNPICVDTIINGQPKRICKGDGIPDFKGPPPPTPPALRLDADVGKITVRWNGKETEAKAPDPFSNVLDFEGYRIYLSRSAVAGDFVLLGSYDFIDWQVWYKNEGLSPAVWQRLKTEKRPLTLPEIKQQFGATVDPEVVKDSSVAIRTHRGTGTRDTSFFFRPEDYNRGLDPIRVYRDTAAARRDFPTLSPAALDSLFNDSLKYEYQYSADHLIPSRPIFVGVSAFDFGDVASGLDPLESSPQSNAKFAFPLATIDRVFAAKEKVKVFPNPYKIDAGYGIFEQPQGIPEQATEYDRKIHFINLPPKCTIRIFTVDGDLVREIQHDYSSRPFDPLASYDVWDVISRNTQSVVTGLYLYSIEAQDVPAFPIPPELKRQVGKLVIMK